MTAGWLLEAVPPAKVKLVTNSAANAQRIESSDQRFECLQTPEFIEELRLRIPQATNRVFVQLMSFDADSAGLEVAQLLTEAVGRGVEVKALVDCFATNFVSDTPASKPEVAQEAADTKAMFEKLRANGVELKFTHPYGPLGIHRWARNHKKLFVIDDAAYLGGINVSDHNFEWHDFMVRAQDQEIVTAVVEDFMFSFDGGRRSVSEVIVTNDRLEATFDSLIANAKESILLASPYAIDIPLTKLFGKATAASKTVVATRRNNFLLFRAITPYLEWKLERTGVEVLSYSNFSHSKFLLVDDSKLLIGSSNFGRHSFWCNQEIGLVIEDPKFIAEFKAEMFKDAAALNSEDSWRAIAFGGAVAYGMHLVTLAIRYVSASRVPNLAQH